MTQKKSERKKPSAKRGKASRKAKQNSKKGRLLEEIAVGMYQSPRLAVQRNAKLSPASGKIKRPRDIDLLLSSRVVSRPATQAVECKNWGKKIGAEKIDAFVGKLLHVGIPHEHGIYISAHGYTKGAIDRAEPAGLKLLTLTGLTEDRLGQVVSEAFQFCVFYLAQVTRVTVTNGLDKVENGGELLVFFDEEEKLCGTVADLIWNRWQEGEPGVIAGEHELTLAVPDGWHQIVNAKRVPVLALNATLQVWALTMEFSGQSTDHSLIRIPDGSLEKRQVKASFEVPRASGTVHQLQAFGSEAELLSMINARGKVRLTTRTPLPRIQWLDRFYYPLSERVAQLLKKHSDDYDEGKSVVFPEIDVAETEGTDLHSMWEPLKEGYPGKRLPVVLRPDSANSVVDVTALLRAGEFKKVIEFEKHLHDNPRPDLADLIHHAYLVHGGNLLGEAESKSGPRFLKLANRAMEKVRRALKLNPNSADAYHDLGVVLREMGRHEEAVKNFDRAVTLEDGRHQTLALRAKSLTDLGLFKDSLASWERVLSIRPGDLEATYFSSGLLGAMDRYEECVAGFDRVLTMSPNHGETWNFRGLGLLHLGRHEDALASFDKARALGVESAEIWSNCGRALQSLGRHQEALNNYEQALSLKPDMFDTMINRGSMLSALGRHEEALNSFDCGLAHIEANSEVWNTRGTSLQNLERFVEALDSYEKALAKNPSDRRVLMNRGLALVELDRLEEALASFNKALEVEPQNIATLRARGMTLYELGHNNEALADYEKILEIENDAYDVWSNKGLVLATLGRWDEAISAADKGLRLAPDQSELVMLWLIRAKILFLADSQAESTEDMVAAWKLDANRVVSLQECRRRFLESYENLVSPSDEVHLVFAEMSWSEAAASMAEAEPAQALLHANGARRAYEQVKGKFVTNVSDSNLGSNDPDTVSVLADGVLERSARRLAEYSNQEFSQWLLMRVGRQDAEAA